VTNVFNLCETQFRFTGINSKGGQTRAVKLWIGFAVDEYTVDVDLAYFIDQAVKDLVLHSALKARTGSYQSHDNSVPMVEATSRSEISEFTRRWV
jgi:hypothetical protein